VCAIGILMRERGFAFDCDIDHVSCAVRYLAPQVQASEATRIMHDFEFTFFKVSPQGRKDPDNVEVVEAIDELIRSNRKVL
jgi:hypothetical protein